MKYLLSAFVYVFLPILTFAQPPGGFRGAAPSITGKIAGVVFDSTSMAPVEFATVVLVNQRTKQQINGTITDMDGSFKLTEIPLGTYDLELSFLGYESKTIQNIALTKEKPDVDLGNISFSSESQLLDEITVVDQKTLVENKIDKIVYNAEKDATTVGGDATDVLGNVPLLSVDFDGNVSLRGSSNLLILINGKPSTIFAGSVGDALKSIPADQIKSIEVITTPTAKYDGEGAGGIVNIITKKKNLEGITGSMNISVGTRSNRANGSVSLAKGRFGLNANTSVWLSWPRPGSNTFYREDYVGDQTRILSQESTNSSYNYGPRGTLSAFYDINGYNSLTSTVTFGGFGGGSESETNAIFDDPINDIYQTYTRSNENSRLNGNFDWTTDYKKTFDKKDQEFSVAFQVSGNNSNTTNNFIQDGNDLSLLRDEVNTNDGLNLEYTFQTDYVHPFSGKLKMETGVKSVLRRIDSDFRYDAFDFGANEYVFDPVRSDIFYYNQDVYAGYASFNIQLAPKWALVAGARVEQTQIKGRFENVENDFENQYTNLLPSTILAYNFSQFSNLKFSYNQRISRPGLRFVNPYVDLSDPRDISYGNPSLLPEVTDQYEIGLNTFIKGAVLNTSVYYRKTNDVIENWLEVDEQGVTYTTYRNIAVNNSIGFNLFASVNVKKFLTLRGNFNLFTYNAESTIEGITLSNEAVLWSGRGSATFNFKNDLRVELGGFYRSPNQSLQGSRASFSIFRMGVTKEFSDRFTLGFSAVEPFVRDKSWPSEYSGVNFYQKANNIIPFRSFNLNLNYRFGKLDFRQRQRNSQIRNDDVKQGGDGNMMMN
jgi:outer membrane receptor protein involved in Fe transport